MSPYNRMHADSKMRRSFLALLFSAGDAQRLALSMKTKTYLGSASVAAAALFAKYHGVPRANEAVSFLVSPDIFEPAALGALFVVGLPLVASTPRLSAAKALALRLTPVPL